MKRSRTGEDDQQELDQVSVPSRGSLAPEDTSESKKPRVGRKRLHLYSAHWAYTPVEAQPEEEEEWEIIQPTEGTSLLAPSLRVSKKPDPATFPWYHPCRFPFRMVVLLFSSFSIIGLDFGYDEIGALAPKLQEEMGITLTEIGLLYSAYCVPNILLALLGGELVDQIGPNIAGFIFSTLLVIGSIMVALADGFWSLLLGRLVFGIGGECMLVCQSRILTEWFEEHELSFSMSFAMTVGRLTVVAVFIVLPPIGEVSLRLALWVAVGVGVASLIATLLTNVFNIIGVRILERDGFSSLTKDKKENRGAGGALADFFTQVSEFSFEFWCLAILNFTFFCLLAFLAFSTVFFSTKYGYSSVEAGQLTSTINFISMILSTPLGILIDHIGQRHVMTFFGQLALPISLFLLAFTELNPVVLVIVIGLSFSIVPCTIYPSIAYVVNEEHIGVAYGIIIAFTNAGLVVSPCLFGLLVDGSGYPAAISSIAIIEMVGVVVGVALWWKDKARGAGVLDMSSQEAGRLVRDRNKRRKMEGKQV